MPQEYWRCPACAHVGPVYTFKLAGRMGGDLLRDPPRRRCPCCGRAQLQDAYERMRPGDEPVGHEN
jgi:rubrerythrin